MNVIYIGGRLSVRRRHRRPRRVDALILLGAVPLLLVGRESVLDRLRIMQRWLSVSRMYLRITIGSDVQRPFATVIVGGLVSATALTLFVLPAAYYVMERRVRERMSKPDTQTEGEGLALTAGRSE